MGQPKFEICQQLAKGLDQLIGDRDDVLIVVSTDMSHYHNGDFARKMDEGTLSAIKALRVEDLWKQCYSGTMELCGFVPATAALLYAREKGLTDIEILRYAHSGDVTGDNSRVVGYSSIIFYDNDPGSPGGAVKNGSGA